MSTHIQGRNNIFQLCNLFVFLIVSVKTNSHSLNLFYNEELPFCQAGFIMFVRNNMPLRRGNIIQNTWVQKPVNRLVKFQIILIVLRYSNNAIIRVLLSCGTLHVNSTQTETCSQLRLQYTAQSLTVIISCVLIRNHY